MLSSDVELFRTPCFVLDETRVRDSVLAIRSALNQYWSNSVLSFSVKTNSWPVLQRILVQEGVWAEVVSEFEYDLAIGCGYGVQHAVCNGASKSDRYILSVLKNGAILHLDSLDEVYAMIRLSEGKSVSFGVRINATEKDMDSDPLSGPMGSRFGLSLRDGDLDVLNSILKANPQLRLESIHLHCNTRTRGLAGYKWLAHFFARIVHSYHFTDVANFDIGGSFGHDFDHPGDGEGRWPSWNEYVSCIADILRAEGFSPDRLRLIIEPGSGLISGCADYYTRVVGSRVFNGKRVLQIDGSRIHVDPHFQRASVAGAISVRGRERTVEASSADAIEYLSGSTCLEKDRLQLNGERLKIEKGDMLKIAKTGGYTFGMSPVLFINGAPEVMVRCEDDSGKQCVSVVQKRLIADDIFRLWR